MVSFRCYRRQKEEEVVGVVKRMGGWKGGSYGGKAIKRKEKQRAIDDLFYVKLFAVHHHQHQQQRQHRQRH